MEEAESGHTGSNSRPSYGVQGSSNPQFCSQHASVGMVHYLRNTAVTADRSSDSIENFAGDSESIRDSSPSHAAATPPPPPSSSSTKGKGKARDFSTGGRPAALPPAISPAPAETAAGAASPAELAAAAAAAA